MSDELEPATPLARIGEACGLAWLTAAICAMPTAWRAAQIGVAFADGWLIGAAVWASLLVPLALIAPRAARGWRGVTGQAPDPTLAVGIAMWAGLSTVALVLLAALLQAKTHHRGLGGATFGVVGAGAVIASAIAAGRLVTAGKNLRKRGVTWAALAIVPAAILLAAVSVLAFPLLRSGGEGAALRSGAWDVLLAIAVTTLVFARGVSPAMQRPARLFALPLAAFTIIAGAARIETSADSAAAVAKGGGVPSAVLYALELWSDRDGDGSSAHFGGGDCDEGDPHRYPGALETPGDGVDSDCDGRDDPPGTPERAAERPATIVASATAEASASASAPAPKRPDIILVTLDTVRADRTSLYGFAKPTTPNLVKLAERGVVFAHAYAVGAETQRALTPIVSGRTLADTPHTQVEWPALDDKIDTVAERLSRAGYVTAAVTSFTWLRRDRGFAQGFELFDESPFRENHPERKITGEKAIEAALAAYGELAGKEKPLFLWLHLFDAHARYLEHPGIDFGKDDASLYAGEIAFVDGLLGRLIEAVAAGPRADRTAWVVHGSHGEAFGEHGSEGHGTQLFDEVLRVPLLIVAPGCKPRRFDSAAVSVLDVAPTVLDLAEVEHDGVAGVSLAPLARGGTLTRAPFFAHAYRRVAVIDWPLKLTSFRHKTGKLSLSLYDLAADPGETKDLASERDADVRRLDALRKQADNEREKDKL